MHRRIFIKNSSLAVCSFPSFPIEFSIHETLHRAIPSTGEKLPIIGMGSWRTFNVSGKSDIEKRISIIHQLEASGNKLLDTSPMYGKSESVIGEATFSLNNRSKFFLANKVWTNGEQNGIEQINESFRVMKTNKIDLYQVHNLVDAKIHLKTLRRLKEEGKIRYIGITHYLSTAYDEMMRYIKSEKLDFIQCNYNIGSRYAADKLIPMAQDHGLAVIINRPFEEGHLFTYVQGKPVPEQFIEMGIKHWPAFFLKYVLSQPGVSFTIPATTRLDHLIENIQAGMGELPTLKDRKKMEAIFERQFK